MRMEELWLGEGREFVKPEQFTSGRGKATFLRGELFFQNNNILKICNLLLLLKY